MCPYELKLYPYQPSSSLHLINICLHNAGFKTVRIHEEVNSRFVTPTYSPPLTPMLGCTLADKMASTMPIMNHSFRTVAKTPMLKLRGRTDRPAGSCQTARQEFPNSPAVPRTILLSHSRNKSRTATSGHMDQCLP